MLAGGRKKGRLERYLSTRENGIADFLRKTDYGTLISQT